MSMRSKLLLLSLTVMALSGCNSSSNTTPAGEKVPPVTKNRTCIPESELMQPSPGIVGGQKVTPYSTDSKRVVMLLSQSEEGAEVCTAAPIASDVLLTAAHCITASAEKTLVITHTGISCESGFSVDTDTQVAAAVVKHEGYDPTTRASVSQSDVALVFLKQSLPWGYPVYKIADPTLVTDTNEIYFYGYGATGYKKGGSGILRSVTLPRADFEIQQDDGKVKLNQRYGSGVCSGDSGGPGLVKINGEMQILGVNSYVVGEDHSDICRGEGYLALANSYTSWIENKMQARGRSLKK